MATTYDGCRYHPKGSEYPNGCKYPGKCLKRAAKYTHCGEHVIGLVGAMKGRLGTVHGVDENGYLDVRFFNGERWPGRTHALNVRPL